MVLDRMQYGMNSDEQIRSNEKIQMTKKYDWKEAY